MNDTSKLIHSRQHDFRRESLNQIIKGLDSALQVLQKKNEEIGWYDFLWYMEDSEPIYGLAFIAFQNYIVGSINDLYGTTVNKVSFFKLDSNLENNENSNIQLIIALANYSKHKDEGQLRNPTKAILERFDLDTSAEITNSPILSGFSLLSDDGDLFKVFNIVVSWREKLFENYIDKYYQSS